MGFYSELSPSTLKAIELIIADNDLCKLLSYNSKDVLFKSNVTNPSSLILTKIFPIPKIPSVETEATTFLNVFWGDILPNNKNEGYRNEVLKFMIVIHLDCMLIDNGIRQYEIMNRIDTIFNNQYYQEIAGHNLQATGRVNPIQLNGDFWGYILSYSAVNDSNLGVRID